MSKEKFKSDTLIFWLQRKKSLKLTNKDIASLSNVPLSTIEQIMCGKIKSPRLDTVEAIERALGINNGIRDEVEINDYFPIPLLGSVVAGVPIESQENTEGYVYISFRPKQEYFALRVHGESMINAGIKDKSVLIVHKQEMAENGDIIVAMLNKEQTVKRFKQVGYTVFLIPENPTFDPIPVLPTDELIILGKVVEVRIAL